eukprot:CAMPEP_0196570906 /NCGR_PEP_ID=MMETSP1081-20130531/1067_1 /TAXON_ID=36882 /ORGANISM="Pyramimonas amylifera, Strain CCMP720" /LENGTH=56 /DNA_ID=CAMNT_0041887597 /DNA_START=111 /DNA_END=281 /DNA_ORIENTATION=+
MGGHVPPGAFGLVNEIIAATVLGAGGMAVFKMWHWTERKKVNDFYSEIDKKRLAAQ